MAQQNPDEQSIKSGDARLKRLRNLARKAIAAIRECQPEDVDDVAECGSLMLPMYSTIVYVLAEINPTRVLLEATMLEACADEDLAALLLEEVNSGLDYGEMRLADGKIMYLHTLELEDPSVDNMVPVIASFADTADSLDGRLKTRLGGTTLLDRVDDEVWL
jgi:hypothetical protein